MNQSIGSIYRSTFSIRRDFSRIANGESLKMRRKVLQYVDDHLARHGISNTFMSDQEKMNGQKVIIRFLKGKLSYMTTDTIRANLNYIFQDNGMKNDIVSAIVFALNEWGDFMKMPNRFNVSFTNNRQDDTSNIVITDRTNNDAIIIESALFIHPDVYSALSALKQDGLRAFFPGQHGAFLHKECLTYSGVFLNPQALVGNAQISVANSPVSVGQNQNDGEFSQVSLVNSHRSVGQNQNDGEFSQVSLANSHRSVGQNQNDGEFSQVSLANSHVSVGQNQNDGAFSQVSLANSHVSVGQNQPKCDLVQGSVGSSQDGWESSQDGWGHGQVSVVNRQDDGGDSQLSVGNNQETSWDERASDGSVYYNQIDLFLNTSMGCPKKNGITKEAGFLYYGNVNTDKQPHDPSGTLVIMFDDTMYNEEVDDIDSQRVITVNHKVAFFNGSFSDGGFECGAMYNVTYASNLVHDSQYVSRFSGILLTKQMCDNTVMYHYYGKLDSEGFPEPLKVLGVSLIW